MLRYCIRNNPYEYFNQHCPSYGQDELPAFYHCSVVNEEKTKSLKSEKVKDNLFKILHCIAKVLACGCVCLLHLNGDTQSGILY